MDLNKELLEEIKYDFNKHYDEDSYYLYYKNADLDTPIGVAGPGDLVVIYGREKTRKSGFVKGIESANYTDDELINLGFSMEIGDQVILDFVTEESKNQWGKNQKKFHTSLHKDNNIDGYYSFHLRQFDFVERLDLIKGIIDNMIKSGKEIGFIFIDQVADLVKNPNDESSVKRVTTFLLNAAEEYDCVIGVVIHANRGGIDTLGHLGAVIDKKCTSSWLVEYDTKTGVSCATNNRARNLPVYAPVCFEHDDRGYIRLVGDEFKF
jgi:hypothetical protein